MIPIMSLVALSYGFALFARYDSTKMTINHGKTLYKKMEFVFFMLGTLLLLQNTQWKSTCNIIIV
jgi:hypothetical protein